MIKQKKFRRALFISSVLANSVFAGAVLGGANAIAAEAKHRQTFDLPAQELASALRQYALQTGRQVAFTEARDSGVVSRAVSGMFTSEEALTLLLRDTPFHVTALPGGVLSVSRAEVDATLQKVVAQGPAAPPAANQQFAQADTAETELVVTGSRLTTGFQTPTPVTVVDSTQLANSAPTSLGEAMRQLPALNGSVQNTQSGQGSANSQTNGQSLLNLRRLGSNRTLVLLNGQRIGVTNVVGSADVNIIPQSLVKRAEVVTGGASASYGSDAVAGVVNFLLDTTFEGLKFDVAGGVTRYGDGRNGKGAVTFGRSIMDGRARIVASAEYFHEDGLEGGETTGREWFDHPTTSVANATGATPRWLLIDNVRARFGTYGGTITTVTGCSTPACTALANTQFLANGSNVPFNAGTNLFGNNSFVTGGDGVAVNQPFNPNATRYGGFLHSEFDLNEHVTAWVEGSYNVSETFLDAQPLQVQTNNQLQIFEDNAYLPTAVRTALLNDPGIDSFMMTRFFREPGWTNTVRGDTTVARYSAGFKGAISDRWSYDTILGYQDSKQILDVRTAISRNLYAAADAIVHPTTGQIVCRSNWYNTAGVFVPGGTGMDPGCAPMNLFGEGNISDAATNFAVGLNQGHVSLSQSTLDINLRGDLGDKLQLGAGPISVATGMNYRRLTARRDVDPLSAIYKDGTGVRGFPTAINGSIGGYTYYNPSPVQGRVTATEGYVEFGVPVLKDKPLFQELAFTAAGRVTDYSQSGIVKTWKLGVNWTVNDDIRFRSTMSSDIRAPTVIELFNTAQVARGTYTLPSSSAPVRITGAGQNVSIGNPNLKPEEARTYVAGVVFSPRFLPGFQASADWYKIKLLGSIESVGGQASIDRCYAGDQTYCALLKVNGTTRPTTTIGLTANDFIEATQALLNQPSQQSTSGIDFEGAYRTALGPGNLGLRITGTRLLTWFDPNNACAVGTAGTLVTDFVGAIGNCGTYPKLTVRGSANYDIGRWGFYLQERYQSDGLRNPNYVTGVDISSNEVPAYWYTDATVQFDVGPWKGGSGEIYFTVQNLLDKDPTVTSSTVGRSWVDAPGVFDLLGRRYTAGVRYKF